MSFQSTSHQLSVDVAVKYGIEEALIISNFQFWINKNYSDGINKHDDRTWTYNTTESLAKLFPYMTTRAVRYALDGLVKKGVLIKGNYNKAGYDRTAWYAFFDEKTWLYTVASDLTKTANGFDKNVNSHLTKTANGFDKNVQPIPDNKPDRKQQIENTNKEISENAKSAFVAPELEKPKVKAEKPKPYYETVELPLFIDRQLFLNWHEMRIVKNGNGKSKLTENAVNLQIKRLSALEQDGYPANQCLLILSETGWLGVTPEGCIKQINESRNRQAQKNPNSATNISQGLQYQANKSGVNYGTKKPPQHEFYALDRNGDSNAIDSTAIPVDVKRIGAL